MFYYKKVDFKEKMIEIIFWIYYKGQAVNIFECFNIWELVVSAWKYMNFWNICVKIWVYAMYGCLRRS